MAKSATSRLSREDACQALGLTPETFALIGRAGDLGGDAEGRFDPLALASAAIRFGLGRSDAADRKVASVAAALSEVRPALERLADLPARAGLEDKARDDAMVEVAAFFTAFAEAMNRATDVLTADD
jgi:hypothetical protein